MANYITTRIACQYFLRESEKSITCEGIIPGTADTRRFASRYEKERHEDMCCTSPAASNLCPVAAYLSREA